MEQIIRCKNCEYCLDWNDGSITCTHWTDQWDMSTELDGFCSFGKLRDGCEIETYEPVRHGHWNDEDKCSICGYGVMPWNNTVNYCPHCGAKMDLSGEDKEVNYD